MNKVMNTSAMAAGSIHSAAIVIPTYNAGAGFEILLKQIDMQSLVPAHRLIIDSASTDYTAELAEAAGWQVVGIDHSQFSHGGTRQQAVELLAVQENPPDIIIFLTQDVRMPRQDSLEKLVQVFEDTDIVAAYGRQRPHEGASIYAALDREFNYPAESRVKSLADVDELGIKTVFFSDSFAAYRLEASRQIGGFPHINICEDMYVAAKLVLAGHRIAYAAQAEVCHSHEPQMSGMWERYRQMGQFHKDNPWIGQSFGTASREGIRLVCYQMKAIWQKRGLAGVLRMLCMNGIKLLAYKWPY